MAYVIDITTKEISTRDTVSALADPSVLVYYKREIPADVLAVPPWYRVIEGDNVRVAAPAERVTIDAQIAADATTAAAAQVAYSKVQAKTDTVMGMQPTHIVERAILSLLIEQLNVLRVKAGLVAITSAQAKTAIEAKIDAITG
jgi:hypothetical protein